MFFFLYKKWPTKYLTFKIFEKLIDYYLKHVSITILSKYEQDKKNSSTFTNNLV